MTDDDELCARLEGPFPATECRKAAARIRELAGENAALREALKPFAEAADRERGKAPDYVAVWDGEFADNITLGHLRTARQALERGHGD